jgi:hypothetical protein
MEESIPLPKHLLNQEELAFNKLVNRKEKQLRWKMQ